MSRTRTRPRSHPPLPAELADIRPQLDAAVRRCITDLRREFREPRLAHPLHFRDLVLRLVHHRLTPPRQLGGARRAAHITTAYGLWRAQQREIRRGGRKRVNWHPIALRCIPDFGALDKLKRSKLLQRLRNGVYNRSSRAWKTVRGKRRRRPQALNGAAGA
jgi:hypothetical protein